MCIDIFDFVHVNLACDNIACSIIIHVVINVLCFEWEFNTYINLTIFKAALIMMCDLFTLVSMALIHHCTDLLSGLGRLV